MNRRRDGADTGTAKSELYLCQRWGHILEGCYHQAAVDVDICKPHLSLFWGYLLLVLLPYASHTWVYFGAEGVWIVMDVAQSRERTRRGKLQPYSDIMIVFREGARGG